MRRVRMVRSDELSAEFPAVRRAQVQIVLEDGRELLSETTTAQGDPENALTDTDLLQKFRSYTTSLVADADQIAKMILNPEPHDTAFLMDALALPAPGGGVPRLGDVASGSRPPR
jgi:2-methylcitrate dehydratase PrpD